MRRDVRLIPVALIINVVIVTAPAVLICGSGVLVEEHVSWALGILSIGVAAEIREQSGRPLLPTVSCREDRTATVMNFAQGAGLLVASQAMIVEAGTRSGLLPTWSGFGASIMLFGVVCRCWAIRTLGGGFTDGFSPRVDRVMVRGPYRYLAHPAELGLLAISIGMGMLLGAARVLVCAVPFLAACAAVRIAAEEWAIAMAVSPGCLDPPGDERARGPCRG